MSRSSKPLGLFAKTELALQIWASFVLVRVGMRRRPLPEFVADLGRPTRPSRRHYAPRRISRAVDQALRIGTLRPTCLLSALVLFRLLRKQGTPVELVIGLPAGANDETAHAWVEFEGRDVGPTPGRSGHIAIARFS
jgi:hypothetical protein